MFMLLNGFIEDSLLKFGILCEHGMEFLFVLNSIFESIIELSIKKS